MGCPMKEARPEKVEATSEYPFVSIYRPWSWVFSSLFNVFILIALLVIAYYYFKTRKSNKDRRNFYYRTIQVRKESKEEKRIAVVTGGNGTLGREIVKGLVAQNEYSVHSLDMLLPDEKEINEAVSTYVQADITNIDDLSIAFKDVDVVFHCASIAPVSVRYSKEDYFQVNLVGTENVIKACTEFGVKRLLYTSSASVTLSKDKSLVSSDCDESCPLPEEPLNPYVASKGAADKLVRAANGNNGLLTCVLRPNAFIHAMVAVLEKNLYCVEDGGINEVSVVSVESAAEAHVLADERLRKEGKESLVAGKAYNITDQKVSMDELTKFVGIEKKIPTKMLPISLVRFLTKVNEAVYKWTGLIAIDESLTTMNLSTKTHTYVGDLARQELGWGPSQPWKEVVRDLLKKSTDKM